MGGDTHGAESDLAKAECQVDAGGIDADVHQDANEVDLRSRQHGVRTGRHGEGTLTGHMS